MNERPNALTDAECRAELLYEIAATQASRIAELETVMACLLDHYLGTYDGSFDELARQAAELVPEWKRHAQTWQPKHPKE